MLAKKFRSNYSGKRIEIKRRVNELNEKIGDLEITDKTIGAINGGGMTVPMLQSLTDSKLDELINNGMSPNVIYNYTKNPLFVNMCLNYWDNNVVRGNNSAWGREGFRILKKLIEHGANLDLPIFHSSNYTLLEYLVDDLRSRIKGQMGKSVTPEAIKNAVEFLNFIQKHTNKKVDLTLPVRSKSLKIPSNADIPKAINKLLRDIRKQIPKETLVELDDEGAYNDGAYIVRTDVYFDENENEIALDIHLYDVKDGNKRGDFIESGDGTSVSIEGREGALFDKNEYKKLLDDIVEEFMDKVDEWTGNITI